MIDRSSIKIEAKGILRTARVSPLMVAAVVIAVQFILERIVTLVETGSLFFYNTYASYYYDALVRGDYDALMSLVASLPERTAMSTFFSLLVDLFLITLMGGYYIYCMGIRQGTEMPVTSLLDGLGVAGKLIWCCIQITVRVFLWSLLLFIPGIIAAYRYRFAYYNILSDPTMTASDAIRLSCRQTMGMKGELFLLDLSFLGWLMLPAILSAFLGLMGLYPVVVASFLLDIWLTPYTTLCDVAYFEEARRRLAPPPPPVWNNTNY